MGLYGIRFQNLAKANFILRERSVFLNLKIAGWKKEIDLLMKKEVRTKKKAVKKVRSVNRISLSKVKNVIASFRIKKFLLSMDTGNTHLNGLLFPVFFCLGQITGKEIGINFKDENRCILCLQNNVARILWAFMKTK